MQFKSYVKRRRISHSTSGGFTPTDLRSVYKFPTAFTGKGKKVGFIELGGSFNQDDLNKYFTALGLNPLPVQFVSVGGAQNTPTVPNDADAEVMLDLCVAIGAAPGIQAIVFTAPNTDQGFANAIDAAITAGVDAISISWGAPENQWARTSITAMESVLARAVAAGIAVFAAAGDNGSSDGENGNNCDYPSSSTFATACGGTSLVVNNGQVVSETVWNDGTQGGATGGGISSIFGLPAYQKNMNVPSGTARGVPDVAAVADPQTGIRIIVNGQEAVIGGTSAVAPFMAAAYCVLSEATGKNLGPLNPILYNWDASVFRDITQGNNGTYTAKVGYDCCTGRGALLLANVLVGGSPTQPPSNPTPPPPITPPTPPPISVGNLQKDVDALFAWVENQPGIANRPLMIRILKNANAMMDALIQSGGFQP